MAGRPLANKMLSKRFKSEDTQESVTAHSTWLLNRSPTSTSLPIRSASFFGLDRWSPEGMLGRIGKTPWLL
jgi:hypothetical protein